MMSIVIDKNKIFQFDLKIDYLSSSDTLNKKIKINKNGSSTLTIFYVDRDFETMSRIIEECSIINSVNGKPLLRSSTFIKLIVQNFIKRIKLSSEHEEFDIMISNDMISKIHYDIVKLVSKTWLEITSRT